MTSLGRNAGGRLVRRRRLLAWSAIPVFLVLCIAAKLLSLGLLGGRAASAFEAADAASVRAAAEVLQLANVIEPHKAPFAAGDADVLDGNFTAARLRFEEALGLVPPPRSASAEACVITVNLVLAIERLGDEKLQAGEPGPAAGLFGEALAAVEAAPEECFAEGLPAGTGHKLAGAEARLQDKLAEAAQEPTPEAGQEPTPPEETADDSAQQSRLQQLEESARQAQRERNSGREREEYLEDTNYAPGPARPW
ncbi:MAG TPA: hypothetical protein VFS79_09890 [Arthrobacter sp.]|nr:hypothetical protein [Arthrobacter sp.]